jgi:FtsP/CotA-like multicopper oxidase with cupredoxin domain
MRGLSTSRWCITCAIVLVAALTAALPGKSYAAEPAAADTPCTEKLDYEKYGLQPFENVRPVQSVGGVLTVTLKIAYTDPTKTKIGECGVTLRSYNGSLIGPTLEVSPGDLMKITIENDLPFDKDCKNNDGSADQNLATLSAQEMPMGEGHEVYDVTNLHTHGLHVSPTNNPNGTHSDNIFVQICPQSNAPYEIQIPKNQPPGTFWYHAHVHGSTALQVSSTMEGAIIVKGGLDNVPEIAAAEDQVFVLQQISYDEKGEIEDEDTMYDNWEQTGSHTMVNGNLVPLITMEPGEVQRWRLINAGVDESLYMMMSRGAGPLYEIATDGIATGRMDAWKSNPIAQKNLDLEPGYRSDVLFKAPMKPGRYFLASAKVPTELSLLENTLPGHHPEGFVKGTDAKYIVAIDVGKDPHNMPLPTEAELKPLVPYRPITELNGAPQGTIFGAENADCSNGRCKPCKPRGDDDPVCNFKFMIDWYVFPNGPTRVLKLGTASRWILEVSKTQRGDGAHPFHIHVNHFQVVRKGPDGRDQTVWKDTLMVREREDVKYRTILSRYEDFPGAFVIHCHILPHEDNGMMQKVVIRP